MLHVVFPAGYSPKHKEFSERVQRASWPMVAVQRSIFVVALSSDMRRAPPGGRRQLAVRRGGARCRGLLVDRGEDQGNRFRGID